MPSTPTDSPGTDPRRFPATGKRRRLFAIAAGAMLSVAGLVYGFVHEGKSFAIEAAVPQLELEENPFVLREAWWNGELQAGETKIIQHQLFKRNEYWFWLGVSQTDAKVSIHVYDSEGKLDEEEAWQDRNVAAVRVEPNKTGVYYIRVAVESVTEPPAEWAVVYAYR
ncbi:MAG: hypothetical protein KDN19_18930 [Verrucomicrobiae bacterium]|nr:hypothetical protein [Verrucomicrobiae bacterium]